MRGGRSAAARQIDNLQCGQCGRKIAVRWAVGVYLALLERAALDRSAAS